mgnify:CR=1 FL=1
MTFAPNIWNMYCAATRARRTNAYRPNRRSSRTHREGNRDRRGICRRSYPAVNPCYLSVRAPGAGDRRADHRQADRKPTEYLLLQRPISQARGEILTCEDEKEKEQQEIRQIYAS